MDEVVFLGISVPEQGGGFSLVSPVQSFGLQIIVCATVESVIDGYGGGPIESHQFGKFRGNGGDQGITGS